jgi:hypothetical protein
MEFSRTFCETFSLIITPFWNVALYSFVNRYHCFGRNRGLLLMNPEDGDIKFV